MLVENLPVINFRNRDLLFVDLELTGLDIETNEIIEIAALLVDAETYKIKGEYYTKVKPTHIETANPDLDKILNYSEEGWKDAKSIKQMVSELSQFAPNAQIAGYNSAADRMFLEKAFEREGLQFNDYFDYHLFDVYSLAYIYFKGKKSPERLRLRMVAEELGIPLPEKAHSAASDVKMTYDVFLKLLDKLDL